MFSGLALAVFVFGSNPVVWAKAGSYKQLNPKGRKAESLPISDRTIRFEVTMPSGNLVKLRVKEGAMAKVGDLHEGYAFALVPVIKDMNKQSASFTIFRLTQDQDGNESIRQLQRLEADWDAPTYTNTDPKFQIRVASTEQPASSLAPATSTKAHPLLAQARSQSKVDCCFQCGSVWACGLCVWMSCGCCCDDPYTCTGR